MNYKNTIRRNLEWFQNSGVMLPASGEWGVAERLIVLTGNEAQEAILRAFPACTLHGDYGILEHRRSDCNFEAVLMFMLAYELTGTEEYRQTAENILNFLYFRSGLLNRNNPAFPAGAWNWSHTNWADVLWLDDNGWVAALQILIGRRYPHLNAQFDCCRWGRLLAGQLLEGFNRIFDPSHKETDFQPLNCSLDPAKQWLGRLTLPHWGMPPVAAFLSAYVESGDDDYRKAIVAYTEYCASHLSEYNTSELSYLLLVAPWAAELFPEEPSPERLSRQVTAKLRAAISGSRYATLPAEHFETPNGPHLADLVYTLNWAFPGWVNLAGISRDPSDIKQAEALAGQLAAMQDDSPSPVFHGCWRGLYDLKAHCWGGGNRYEGGAGSIYTGWTNAPILIGFLLHELGLTFRELMNAKS